jgi:GT2 family glycosyltransferase
MKIIIAIPCMDTQESNFSECLTEMLIHFKDHHPDDTIDVKYLKASLVYDARNQLATYVTTTGGYDYVLWLDSDMTFEPDLLDRMLEDMEGRQAVTGLCFGRRPPFNPCIYSKLDVTIEGKMIRPENEIFKDYPRDQIFEVQACGFACLLMRVDVLEAMGIYGVPFFPVGGLGEDLTFCWRARKLDIKFHCDSRLKIGHIMRISVDEGFRDKLFEGQQ